jgi:hypothetical protein
MTDAELKHLIDAAWARYDLMTPEQQEQHDWEQRRSFARGMCPSNRDYKEYCAMVDRILPPLKTWRIYDFILPRRLIDGTWKRGRLYYRRKAGGLEYRALTAAEDKFEEEQDH